MAKPKSKAKQPPSVAYPFPFFGAGDASYFEWAEVHVYFAAEPKAATKKRIKAKVPPPLRDAIAWEGRELMVASGQDAHWSMTETYGKKTRGAKSKARVLDDDGYDDDGEYGGTRFYFAKEEEVDAFNADIEAWLNDAHALAPIVAAYRSEDAESGGTQLSKWHSWSLDQLPGVLETMAPAMKGKRDTHAAHMLRGILWYAKAARKKLAKQHKAWLDRQK
jgi:hypothetical protein